MSAKEALRGIRSITGVYNLQLTNEEETNPSDTFDTIITVKGCRFSISIQVTPLSDEMAVMKKKNKIETHLAILLDLQTKCNISENIRQLFDFEVTTPLHSVLIFEKVHSTLVDEMKGRNNRGFSISTIRPLLKQMLRALADLKIKRIVHQDVRPENFVFRAGNKENIMLTGFEHARYEHQERRSMKDRKIDCLAPEVLLDEGEDHKSDVFSLGIVAIYMFVGQSMFDCEGNKNMTLHLYNRLSDTKVYPYYAPLGLCSLCGTREVIYKTIDRGIPDLSQKEVSMLNRMDDALLKTSKRKPLRFQNFETYRSSDTGSGSFEEKEHFGILLSGQMLNWKRTNRHEAGAAVANNFFDVPLAASSAGSSQVPNGEDDSNARSMTTTRGDLHESSPSTSAGTSDGPFVTWEIIHGRTFKMTNVRPLNVASTSSSPSVQNEGIAVTVPQESSAGTCDGPFVTWQTINGNIFKITNVRPLNVASTSSSPSVRNEGIAVTVPQESSSVQRQPEIEMGSQDSREQIEVHDDNSLSEDVLNVADSSVKSEIQVSDPDVPSTSSDPNAPSTSNVPTLQVTSPDGQPVDESPQENDLNPAEMSVKDTLFDDHKTALSRFLERRSYYRNEKHELRKTFDETAAKKAIDAYKTPPPAHGYRNCSIM